MFKKKATTDPSWKHPKLQEWLSKRGYHNKSYKRRFVVLDNFVLSYYKSPEQANKGIVKPEYSINMRHCLGIRKEVDGDQKAAFSVIRAADKRVFMFSASSEKDRDRWMRALEQAAGFGKEDEQRNAKPDELGVLEDNQDDLADIQLRDVIHRGWLSKAGGLFKGYRKRYFMLTLDRLWYYKSPPASEAKRTLGSITEPTGRTRAKSFAAETTKKDEPPLGSLLLERAIIAAEPQDGKFAFNIRPTTFSAKGKKVYTLVAESKADMDIWVNFIQLQINLLDSLVTSQTGSVMTKRVQKLMQLLEEQSSESVVVNSSIVSYLPRMVIDRICDLHQKIHIVGGSQKANEQLLDLLPPDNGLFYELKNACVVIADISGFTRLNEKLGVAEKVSHHINTYFTSMLDVCAKHGGDVVKFAGDALIVLFYQHTPSWPYKIEPFTSALRAAQCCLELQEKCGTYTAEEVTLTLHIGLSAGTVYAMHVGGEGGEFEFLVAGAPFKSLGPCLDLGKAGDIVCCRDTGRLLRRFIKCTEVRPTKVVKKRSSTCEEGEDLILIEVNDDDDEDTELESDNTYTGGETKILAVTEPVKLVPLSHNPIWDSSSSVSSQPLLSAVVLSALKTYIPKCVTYQQSSTGNSWLAENRRASVIFVNLKGLSLDSAIHSERQVEALKYTQAVLTATQAVVIENDGYRRQFLVDDKGTVLIVVFGVPPYAHEDDVYRAVKCSLEIREALESVDPPCEHSIGVATGEVYVGSVGSAHRKEHAVVGDTVNKAARLSGKTGRGILCDEATYSIAGTFIRMEAQGEIAVKGKEEKIAIYAPHSLDRLNILQKSRMGETMGRQKEIRMFMQSLVKLDQHMEEQKPGDEVPSQPGSTFIIQGTGGIGKTQLIRQFYLLTQLNKGKYQIYYVAADPTKSERPLYLWNHFLTSLMDLPEADGTARTTQLRRQGVINYVKEELSGSGAVGSMELLDCLFSDFDLSTKQLPKVDKTWEALKSLIYTIVHQAVMKKAGARVENKKSRKKSSSSDHRPTVWLVDDLHLADVHSLNLLSKVATHKDWPFLMIATARPETDASAKRRHNYEVWASAFKRIKSVDPKHVLQLEGLDASSITRLVSQQLLVKKSDIPLAVMEFICDMSLGNPLYAKEIAMQLVATGRLAKDDESGQYVLSVPPKMLSEMELPLSLKRLFVQQIDALGDRNDILVCKLASTFGRFPIPHTILLALFQTEGGHAAQMNVSIEYLTNFRKILVAYKMDPQDPSYMFPISGASGTVPDELRCYYFVHPMIQQTSYSLILFKQKQNLHLQNAASYLDARRNSVIVPVGSSSRHSMMDDCDVRDSFFHQDPNNSMHFLSKARNNPPARAPPAIPKDSRFDGSYTESDGKDALSAHQPSLTSPSPPNRPPPSKPSAIPDPSTSTLTEDNSIPPPPPPPPDASEQSAPDALFLPAVPPNDELSNKDSDQANADKLLDVGNDIVAYHYLQAVLNCLRSGGQLPSLQEVNDAGADLTVLPAMRYLNITAQEAKVAFAVSNSPPKKTSIASPHSNALAVHGF
mmetsp:Transcript_28206/g.55486  ORF Transcript_28206/g.55486 Transcript_28206/m.55486 type:complete len:1544 (+) Transcript_28206:59-4690(+)